MYSTRREIRGVFEENKGDGAEVVNRSSFARLLPARTCSLARARTGTQEPLTYRSAEGRLLPKGRKNQ